jgi:hypothetical protein
MQDFLAEQLLQELVFWVVTQTVDGVAPTFVTTPFSVATI